MYQTRPLVALLVVSVVTTLTRYSTLDHDHPLVRVDLPHLRLTCTCSRHHTMFSCPFLVLVTTASFRNAPDFQTCSHFIRHALGSTTNRCNTTFLPQRRESSSRALSKAKIRTANNSRTVPFRTRTGSTHCLHFQRSPPPLLVCSTKSRAPWQLKQIPTQ